MRKFVSLASGLPHDNVIQAADNRGSKKNPEGVYCTFQIDESYPIGGPEITNTRNTIIDQVIKQSVAVPITLNFYKKGAFGVASSLEGAGWIPEITSLLVKENIGIRSQTKARKRPFVINGKNEGRSIVTMELVIDTERNLQINPIERVTVKVSVDDDYEIDFEVNNGNEEPTTSNK